MLGLTPDQIRNGLLLYLLLMACLCLRAYGQAWLANRLGDPADIALVAGGIGIAHFHRAGDRLSFCDVAAGYSRSHRRDGG